MLVCPRCDRELTTARTRHGRLYVCPDCRGRAVGLPVLRKIASAAAVRRIWHDACEIETRTGAACPVCRKASTAVAVPTGSDPVEVDLCRPCHFLWLDRYELERMPPRPPRDPEAEARDEQRDREARERLAVLAVQRQARLDELKEENPFSVTAEATPDEPWQWLPGVLGLPVEVNHPVAARPWFTWSIAAVLVLVYLATYSQLDAVVQQFGMIPDQVWRLGGLTLVTSFFLHGGILHLLGNTYFLLIFGDNVEEHLGPLRMVGLVLAASLFGDAMHIALEPNSAVPCIGASGGISGIIAYYALRFPKARIGLLLCSIFLIRWGFFRWFFMRAWFAFLLWIGLQLLLGYQQLLGMTNVSAAAHLGGAVVGVVAWLWWDWAGSRLQSVRA